MALWTDNESLVQRMRKLQEFDPISAYAKNDHDLYIGIRDSLSQIEISGISHIRGHQDKEGRELNHVEKLNVLADELATRAVKESEESQVEWNRDMGPILEIDGVTITKKKV